MWGHVAGWLMLGYTLLGMIVTMIGAREMGRSVAGRKGAVAGALIATIVSLLTVVGAISISVPVK